MGREQNQFYQVLQQANMRVIQMISTSINAASEKVAKDKKLTVIVNKDACFYYTPALDVTDLVVKAMDTTYEQEAKKAPAAPVTEGKPQ